MTEPRGTDPAVGGRWSIYGVAHVVGATDGVGWTPACDMRMTKWPLRIRSECSGSPSSADLHCAYCAAGVQR